MPQPRTNRETSSSMDIGARIVTGADPDRFYCPHPGCNRSFAELWRLKVHYRAPPDVRGSGKERGHGTELKFCPKCGKELKPGKHHVGCTAGKSAPRQAAKRQRQMSSTTETGDWMTQTSSDGQTDDSDSWEEAFRRQVSKVRRQRSLDTESSLRHPHNTTRDGSAAAPAHADIASHDDPACRIARLKEALTTGDPNAELVFTTDTMADFGLILRGSSTQHNAMRSLHLPPIMGGERAPSPPPPLSDIRTAGDDALAAGDLPLLRVPSPPPLPPDWDFGPGQTGLLFDFDQFDASRKGLGMGGGFGGGGGDGAGDALATAMQDIASEPIVTATASMNPSEVSNPSDDYIWQILFAGENDPVPKRVTAHLHHTDHPHTARRGDNDGAGNTSVDLKFAGNTNKAANGGEDVSIFDEPDVILDAIPWPEGGGKGLSSAMGPPPPRKVHQYGDNNIAPGIAKKDTTDAAVTTTSREDEKGAV